MNDYSKINELSSRISLYKENEWSAKRFKRYPGASEATLWGLPQLFSRILKQSRTPEHGFISMETAVDKLDKFNAAEGTTVSLKDLMHKAWLRVVMEEVQFSHSIRQLTRKVDEFLTYQLEFKFLAGIITGEKVFEKDAFEALVKKFESDHGVSLDLSLAQNKIWSVDKQDKIKVWSMESHRILVAHLEEFRFLNELLRLGEVPNPLIALSDLEEMFRIHRAYFSACPDYDFFESKEIFKEVEDSAEVSISVHELAVVAGDLIYDQITALLWDMVTKDDFFDDDKARLLFWFSRSVRGTGSADPVPHLNAAEKSSFLNAALDMVLKEKDFGNGTLEYRKLRLDAERHHGSALVYDYNRADDDIDFNFSRDYLNCIMR